MTGLTDEERERYNRHIVLPEVGSEGQERLKGASVLLAGLGASGSAAALYLAAAGIGRLTLWDPHLVSAADLESAMAHDRERIGMPRSRSAARTLLAINPAATVEVLDRESDVAGAIFAHQVVLASLGDWEDLNRTCRQAGSLLILCGVHGAGGGVATFGRSGPCYACLGDESARRMGLFPEEGGLPARPGRPAAVAAAAGVVGVIAATEVVKAVIGLGEGLAGRVLTYDGWSARFGEESFGLRAGCPVCGGK